MRTGRRNTRYTETHLSRVLGTLPLGRWSCRHQQCFGISGLFQPGPAPGTGPLPHLWAGPQPQPRHLWCCLPGGGSQCRPLWENQGGQCRLGLCSFSTSPHQNHLITVISCLSGIGSRQAFARKTPCIKENNTVDVYYLLGIGHSKE